MRRPAAVHPKTTRWWKGSHLSPIPLILNGMATLQIVWFYLLHIPSAMDLAAFETGVERTPFQYRLLMIFPLRWAHHSRFMAGAASVLQSAHGWLPSHVSPEALLQALVDVFSLAIAGIVTSQVYQASSRTRTLGSFIYPLTLILAASTYAFSTNHALRFVYDLPALAFFSVGLALIYFRYHAVWFVLLFVIATVNRETSLLLLPLYAGTQCLLPTTKCSIVQGTTLLANRAVADWTRLYAPSNVIITVPLALLWIAWRFWLAHHFAGNPSAAGPRLLLNLGLLLCPLSWPQVASACGFLLPVVFACKGRVHDPVLRLWLWLLPAWFAVMLFFGLLIEPRVFGELIPLVACTSALIAEQSILRQSRSAGADRILPFKMRRLS